MSSINPISGIAPACNTHKRGLESGDDRSRKYRRIARSNPPSPILDASLRQPLTPPENSLWRKRKSPPEKEPATPNIPSPIIKEYETKKRSYGVLSPKTGPDQKPIAGASKTVLKTLDPTTIALSSSPWKQPNPQAWILQGVKEEKIYKELQGAPHIPGLQVCFDADGQERIMLVENVGLDLYEQYLNPNNLYGDPIYMEDIERLGKQLLETLNYMHERGYLHGDLKPLNISAQGHIFDFGLSIKIGTGSASFAKGLRYTDAYRPPETTSFNQSVLVSDIWSVGCILWELYAKETLFPVSDQPKDSTQISVDLFHAYQRRLGILIPVKAGPYLFEKNGILKKPSDEKLLQLTHFTSPFPLQCTEKELQLFDLIRQMIQFDPNKRISAKEALQHPFFSSDISTDRTVHLSVKGNSKHSFHILGKNGNILKTVHLKYFRPSYCCHIPKEENRLRFQFFDPNFPRQILHTIETPIEPTQKELEIDTQDFPLTSSRKLFEL